MNETDEMQFEQAGPLAIATLNRPKSLNALTLAQIRAFHPKLKAWEQDSSVAVVVLRGAGEKAFCAGGDVRSVAESRGTDASITQSFFWEEYRLNRRIFEFSKPYVSLLDGITMGGGVGLSAHGSHRVSSEKTMVAMPETALGLFPDVGGSYALPRMPGELGMYLALTGARIHAADCLYLGLTTHHVPSAAQESLVSALSEGGAVDEVVDHFHEDPGEAPIRELHPAIDRTFDKQSVEAILEALAAEDSDWAREQHAHLLKMSPTSLKITFEQLRRGRDLDFDACMVMEYRMVQRCMAATDFFEGVRAVLIDKDRNPKWNPATLAEVDEDLVAEYFAPLGESDLDFED